MTTTDETEPQSSSTLLRRAPLIVFLLFLVTVAVVFVRPIGDPDTWWHLRLGGDLARTWALSDPPRWTRFATQPWVATQWLPEIVAARWTGWLGLPGLVWLVCATVLVLAVTLYVVCRREAGRLPATLATILGFGGMAATLTPRPQLVSFVLLVVTVGAWLQTSRTLRTPWWLVPMSWVWACCHGLWFTGPAVGLVVVAGLFLDGRARGRKALTLLAIPVLSVLVAAMTPVGPRLIVAPFAVGGITQYITEWQTPSFRELGPALTAAMITAVMVLAARRPGRASWVSIGLVVLASAWTLLSVRTVTLGAAIATPLLAGAIDQALPQRALPSRGVLRGEKLTLAATTTACLVIVAIIAAALPSLRVPANVPATLNTALDAFPAHTVIWNDFSLGGWLDYGHPNVEVVADGRAEAFGATQLEKYGLVARTEPGWDEIIHAVGAHVALVAADSPLAAALQQRLGWRPVGEDNGYVLLTDGTLG
ncbi:MAG TPA: hypothetical protein VIG79_14200 [Lapillicoccus sp.]|uniref:hypothetical protein n=1 Tax=Lapillicoccus sp. TaxID=1909287 RepID=UPI002F94D7CB